MNELTARMAAKKRLSLIHIFTLIIAFERLNHLLPSVVACSSFLFGEKVACNCRHNLQSFYYHPNWIWAAVPVSSLLVKSVPHKNEVLVSLEEFVCKVDRCRLRMEDKFCDQILTCKQYPSLFHPMLTV